jgi:hypothetical protein
VTAKRSAFEGKQVPAAYVPKDMIKAGKYRSSGYRCNRCEWNTDSGGFSGRQAVRAHSKIHALDRRAWRRPLAATLIALAVLACLALAGRISLVPAPAAWAVVTMPGAVMPAMSVAGPALTALFVLATYAGWDQPTAGVLWTARAVGAVCMTAPILVAGREAGLVDADVVAYEYALAAVAGAGAALCACVAGIVALERRRRVRRPTGYTEKATATDLDAEVELKLRRADRKRRAPMSDGRAAQRDPRFPETNP